MIIGALERTVAYTSGVVRLSAPYEKLFFFVGAFVDAFKQEG